MIKYRERYRLAVERATTLEEELEKAKTELKTAKDSYQILVQTTTSSTTKPVTSNQVEKDSTTAQPMTSTSTDNMPPSASSPRHVELQLTIDRLNKEIGELRLKSSECMLKSKEWEDKYHSSEEKYLALSKETVSNSEAARRFQRDLKEAIAQKEDQEQRISTLEQRYVNLQRECSSLTDLNSRLETELAIRENSLKHAEERFKNIQNKLEASEQKYEQLLKKTQFAGSGTIDEYSKNLHVRTPRPAF